MSRLKKINLNKYDRCDDETTADIAIIPFVVNGEKQPILYFKRKESADEISDVTDAKWFMHCKISDAGTREEYNARVDWWFSMADEEYKSIIYNGWGSVVRNLPGEIDKIKSWLKTTMPSRRKKSIHGFITKWLNRTAQRHMGRNS